MKLFDTHCHLFMEPLISNLPAVMERAGNSSVVRINVPSVDTESIETCLRLASLPGVVVSLGVHPWWADQGVDPSMLRDRLSESGAVAIGEIGLDWKSDTSKIDQIRVFTSQLNLALELDLPVVIHCRAAFQDMLEILRDYPVMGMIHAWSRPPELMYRFLDAGLFISFGGAITRPGAKRAAASASRVPHDRFVLETDAPSIGMKDLPAEETEPGHVSRVLVAMSELIGETIEKTAQLAWQNSNRLFRLEV